MKYLGFGILGFRVLGFGVREETGNASTIYDKLMKYYLEGRGTLYEHRCVL